MDNNVDNNSNKYKKKSLILWIVIFFLIILFTVIIIVSFYTLDNQQITFVNTKNGSFLYTCNDYQCDDSYICDSNTLTCKKNNGTSCSNYLDCANELFCSGICVTGPTGGLGNYCPCIPGQYICSIVSSETGETQCKIAAGGTCTPETQNDCASQNCFNNICQSGRVNSAPCIDNSFCQSNICNIPPTPPTDSEITIAESNYFCQSNNNLTSGKIGSACQGTCYDSDLKGAVCDSELICQCAKEDSPGTCKQINTGLASKCNSLFICTDNLICADDLGNINGTGCTGTNIDDSLCKCMFNYTNPNIITTPAKCIDGMIIDYNDPTICLNALGLGCDGNSMCGSNKCSTENSSSYNPSLSMFNFKRTTDTDGNGVNFINSDDISIIAVNNQIPSTINNKFLPITMFSTSYNNIDTIYLIDKNNGLLALVNDLDTPTSTKTWVQILPSETKNSILKTRTLKCVAFNGIFWLLLFDEYNINDVLYSALYYTTSTSSNPVIPNINYPTAMKYFNPPNSPFLDPNFPGRLFDQTNKGLNPLYVDIAPLNNISTNNSNTNIYINYILLTLKDVNFDSGYFYNILTTDNYFQPVKNIPIDGNNIEGLVGIPLKYYYDQGTTGATGTTCSFSSPDQVCINPIGQTGNSVTNNCYSGYNISYVENCDDKTSCLLTFTGNNAGVFYPNVAVGNTKLYRVFDYSVFSPGATGLYFNENNSDLCNLGFSNSNTIMLCEVYNNDNTFLECVVILVNKQTISILPYQIDLSFKCLASYNAFYIFSSDFCIS